MRLAKTIIGRLRKFTTSLETGTQLLVRNRYWSRVTDLPVPYDDLDPKIAPLVRTLNENGFATIGSCEGSRGHSFNCPTVLIDVKGDLDAGRKHLCAFMMLRGAKGFTVKTCCYHQRSMTPEGCSHVELELWSFDCLKDFRFKRLI